MIAVGARIRLRHKPAIEGCVLQAYRRETDPLFLVLLDHKRGARWYSAHDLTQPRERSRWRRHS